MVNGFGGITTMQEMTGGICNQANENDSKQLIDERDGKTYWATKLKDGNCWMTQNLDLDLNIYNTLTPNDTDLLSNWTPSASTQVTPNPSFTTTTNDVQSCDPAQGGTDKYCVDNKCNNLSATSSNNGHDTQGNYYSWGAATAGQATTLTSTTAGEQSTQSICPKGWRLPLSKDSNNAISGSFYNLLSKYGLTSNASNTTTGFDIYSAPLYFVYGGFVNSSSLVAADSNGYYWSSTAVNNNIAYILYFTISVSPSINGNRYYGYSVRCVAR